MSAKTDDHNLLWRHTQERSGLAEHVERKAAVFSLIAPDPETEGKTEKTMPVWPVTCACSKPAVPGKSQCGECRRAAAQARWKHRGEMAGAISLAILAVWAFYACFPYIVTTYEFLRGGH